MCAEKFDVNWKSFLKKSQFLSCKGWKVDLHVLYIYTIMYMYIMYIYF